MNVKPRSERTWLAAFAAVAVGISSVTAAEREVTDADITRVVETEMFTDPGVQPNGIDVQTTEGIVTLSGSVNNLLAKERALKVAETVKGVRSVVNRIQVKPGDASDSTIRRDIVEALIYDPVTESWEVDVEVNNGVASVTGTVDSWQERTLAAKVIKGVKGVRGIENNLRVTYTDNRSDGEIREEIEKRLMWDTLVDGALINVTVNDGKVSLSGTVGSAAEKSRAEMDAWVTGVTEVKSDQLDIRFWARDDQLRQSRYGAYSDEEILDAVKDAFLYDPRVLSFNVQVSVDNGMVTLNGNVDNMKAKQAAAQDARNTVGVWHVNNHIRVRPVEQTDKSIARNVRNALSRDPYVDRYDITVAVNDGEVTLTGTVDSAYEKAQAETVAAGIKGVSDVANLLVAHPSWMYYNPHVGGLYPYDYDWYQYPSSTVLTDMEIKRSIEDEFFWSPFVDGGDIQVTVNNGTAILTGTVATWSEYLSAEENAREGGAIAVDNDLIIGETS